MEETIVKADKDLSTRFAAIRQHTEFICRPLKTEDYVVQPCADVSPPKWHLGHTTWFFETFILKPFLPDYKVYDSQYDFVFNSYYETVGARVIRTDRGNLSRPTVEDVFAYRKYIDEHMGRFLENGDFSLNLIETVDLGLNHEQQHQELLMTDIKYILGHNPLFPPYATEYVPNGLKSMASPFHQVVAGNYQIGFEGEGFSFDNEHGRHQVWLNDFKIATSLVSNREYLEFINSGGYQNFNYWHAEGWDWVRREHIGAPLYWHLIDGKWMNYDLGGLTEIIPENPVCHLSFYEATAFANWKGFRLPTEAEWEVASAAFDWGSRWEWTNSAYLPYPGFKKADGAIGEYNGKFMVSQMVLRGASQATPVGHSRSTYRNFFHPHLRWQFTGLRLILD
ncbi:ergothioneine biosynthesis protein EgtB [Dyadobacter bucti]|uniref:ergothioneine biosynthesis protein EgtB n=1 Tax=Dyadobacter bucti TaxID=2572203 RepID=UPI001109C3C3|nr:ergothioneine biosynthesis protein EgtB [Dyadobacter bucti]